MDGWRDNGTPLSSMQPLCHIPAALLSKCSCCKIHRLYVHVANENIERKKNNNRTGVAPWWAFPAPSWGSSPPELWLQLCQRQDRRHRPGSWAHPAADWSNRRDKARPSPPGRRQARPSKVQRDTLIAPWICTPAGWEKGGGKTFAPVTRLTPFRQHLFKRSSTQQPEDEIFRFFEWPCHHFFFSSFENQTVTWIASTVALKTGLLCLTVLQYFGLLGFVRLQPYFSKMFRAVDKRCSDASVWQKQREEGWDFKKKIAIVWPPTRKRNLDWNMQHKSKIWKSTVADW